MAGFFNKIKEKFNDLVNTEEESKMLSDADQDYVELDTERPKPGKQLLVRTYNVADFTDLKPILDHLREGNTIAILNIKTLKDKDLVELKRSINKLKKTTDALSGDIAGFGEDYIIVTPSIAKVYRGNDKSIKEPEEDFD